MATLAPGFTQRGSSSRPVAEVEVETVVGVKVAARLELGLELKLESHLLARHENPSSCFAIKATICAHNSSCAGVRFWEGGTKEGSLPNREWHFSFNFSQSAARVSSSSSSVIIFNAEMRLSPVAARVAS